MADLFSTNPDLIMSKTNKAPITWTEEPLIRSKYQLDRIVKTILENNFQKISLQFDDNHLSDAAAVLSQLKSLTAAAITRPKDPASLPMPSFYILADTTHGSCCADVVAASHVGSDLLVHLGHACLSKFQTDKIYISIMYVFIEEEIDVTDCVSSLHTCISQHQQESQQPILLLYHVSYNHAAKEIGASLSALRYTRVVVSDLNVPGLTPEDRSKIALARSALDDESLATLDGRSLYTLLKGTTLKDYTLVYIGEANDDRTYTDLVVTHGSSPIIHYSPTKRISKLEDGRANNLLRQRYHVIQKVKQAGILGILVCSTGLVALKQTLRDLKTKIRAAYKKSYVIVLGKLNEFKIANFMEIDAFVLLACRENSLITSRDYFKPVATVFDLEMALNPDYQWTGDYITDFSQVLTYLSTLNIATSSSASEEEGQDDAPEFSLLDGSLLTNYKYIHTQLQDKHDPSQRALTTREMTIADRTAGRFLQSRSYKGLEMNLGLTPVEPASLGEVGTPRQYEREDKS